MSIIKRKAGSDDIVKSILEFDEVPTEGSHNLVESGSVAQAIGNLGQPLQWKGPATVAQLNAGITGIQPGWTYTLTDAGTLTDGSVAVEKDDKVAWTDNGEWFKVGGDSGKIAVFECTYSQEAHGYVYPAYGELNTARLAGKLPVIVEISPVGRRIYYVATHMSAYKNNVNFHFVDSESGAMLKLEGPTSNPVWSSGSAYDDTLSSTRTNAVQNSTLYTVIGDVETLLAAL